MSAESSVVSSGFDHRKVILVAVRRWCKERVTARQAETEYGREQEKGKNSPRKRVNFGGQRSASQSAQSKLSVAWESVVQRGRA